MRRKQMSFRLSCFLSWGAVQERQTEYRCSALRKFCFWSCSSCELCGYSCQRKLEKLGNRGTCPGLRVSGCLAWQLCDTCSQIPAVRFWGLAVLVCRTLACGWVCVRSEAERSTGATDFLVFRCAEGAKQFSSFGSILETHICHHWAVYHQAKIRRYFFITLVTYPTQIITGQMCQQFGHSESKRGSTFAPAFTSHPLPVGIWLINL